MGIITFDCLTRVRNLYIIMSVRPCICACVCLCVHSLARTVGGCEAGFVNVDAVVR